jgi:hypothetical protein
MSKRVSLIMPILILLAAIYVAWIFYSRWSGERQARATAETQVIERARKEVELNGGTRLQIRSLYADPGVVRRGETAQLCYGVVNAKNVSFDPPVANVWPSMSRCVEVSPRKSTKFTLTADDGAGHSEKAQVAIEVK